MANFIHTNMNQTVLMDINYLDQLGTNTFEFYLYTLLNKPHFIDDFLSYYENHSVGRKAYPPQLFFVLTNAASLLVVLLLNYAKQI